MYATSVNIYFRHVKFAYDCMCVWQWLSIPFPWICFAMSNRRTVLVSILRSPKLANSTVLTELIMVAFKILMRKDTNRQNLNSRDVNALVDALRRNSKNSSIVREGANAILNMCYDKANVISVVKSDCVNILIRGLETGNPPSIQASCAGALQSIS